MADNLFGRLLLVALLALSMIGCGTSAKTIPFVLDAKSGTPTMTLGTLTVQFAELKLEKPLPGTLQSSALMVSGGNSSTGGAFSISTGDREVKVNYEYKQSGSSGTLILKFEKPAQKEFVFEIINDGKQVRYSDKTYSLKDSLTLVIDGDGVRENSGD